MCKVVAGVFSDDTFAPKNGSDLPIANAHGHDWHDVCQYEVDDVVAEMQRSFYEFYPKISLTIT